MYRDFDYIKTSDGIIFIVHGDNHPAGKVRAVSVYFPQQDGDRTEKATGKRYIKRIEELGPREFISKLHPEYLPKESDVVQHGLLVNASDVVRHYKPRDKTKECLSNGVLKNTEWESLIIAINKIAKIPIEDIGIYGSILVGISTDFSDVDLVIYGKNNLKKLKDNFDNILENTGINKATKEQRVLRIKSWKKYTTVKFDQLLRMEERRWSRINVSGNDLTAIRFTYRDEEIPPEPVTSYPLKEIIASGLVLESQGTHFQPRTAKVKIDNKIINVVSYNWLFYSCVADGDKVEIFGNYRKDGQREYITLDEPNHYMCPTTQIDV